MNLEEIGIKLEIDEKYIHYFFGGSISKPIFNKTNKTLKIDLKVNKPLPYVLYKDFINKMNKLFDVETEVLVISKNAEISVKDLQSYFNDFINKHKQLANKNFLVNLNENQEICILYSDEAHKALIQKHFSDLQLYFLSVGIKNKLSLIKANNEPKLKRKSVKKTAEIKQVTPNNEHYRNNNSYEKLLIKDLSDAYEKVEIEAEIFKVDNRKLRSGKLLQILTVKDESGAYIVKRFEGRRHSEAEILSLKKRDYINVKGNIQYDTFSKSLNIMADKIIFAKKPNVVVDNEVEKRVELHAHTNKSEMDGVTKVEDLIDYAYNLGHKAVAITDHMVVQAFPDAYNHHKRLPNKDNFKVIYGTEFNIVEDDVEIIKNYQTDDLIGDTFIVFDIETTGLSATYDEIIEFGAVKLQNNTIVDTIQFFIKPEQTISEHITELTKIDNNHVKNANSFDDEVKRIKAFFANYPLVAHNASFDVDFINAKLSEINEPLLTNTIIDTMYLSRLLNPQRRYHSLGSVARFYNIPYDNFIAHRADYDADITAHVFAGMLSQLKELNIKTFAEIQAKIDTEFLINAFDSHMSVLVENQTGLKNLYKLISKSHTEYLAIMGNNNNEDVESEVVAVPRLLRGVLNEHREGLLIGSACQNGLLFEKALNKTQADLEDEMQFYDYIEVMPPENYRNLVERFQFDKSLITKALTRIVLTAKRLNKVVVATGDVHYLEKSDKIIRDIYINAQGIGGVRHPLYERNQQKRLNTKAPDQHFRTTAEMLEAFDFLANDIAYEIVVNNPNLLADSIDNIQIIPDKLFTPEIKDAQEKLVELCYSNARKIYGQQLPDIVVERLEKELSKIIQHGFAVIYYISYLLVDKSYADGYIVGSRGSVGSSFVATMAKITEVNPLPPHYICLDCHYNEFFLDGSVSSGFDLPMKKCPNCNSDLKVDGQDIPFETFLGFEGDKVPDIDLNFSSVYQDKAHSLTREIFGEDYTVRAGTIGTVAERTAFGYIKGYAEELLIDDMSRAESEVLASLAEGVKRTSGQHPGGIIVIPDDMDVHDFTPVQYPANNIYSEWKTTHFQYSDIEDNLLKLDILGHVDPTAMKLLQDISGIDVLDIPMNDEKVMSIFNSTNNLNIDDRIYSEETGAVGLPEFGTPFVRRMLEATKPKNFSELLIISGLSHGTDVWANNAENLIEQGISLKEVIGCRDDIMVFLTLKGLREKDAFDIMESVRRGRGLTPEWIELMHKHEVPDWYIDSCEKIKYMFPKAHAVAYVIMAVRIAWFKVYYPHYYYVSYFSLRAPAFEIDTMIKGENAIRERIAEIKNTLNDYSTSLADRNRLSRILQTLEVSLEMYLRGYRFSNIDINKSLASQFLNDPNDEKVIIPPFNTIDGLGSSVGESIVKARAEGGFLSKQDLMNRTLVSNNVKDKLDELKVLEDLQEENQLSFF